MNLLRAFDPKLYDLLQPYRVTRGEDMPVAYRKASGGRWLRNDLGVMVDDPSSLLAKVQPWQSIPRMEFFYRIPLPMRIKSGNVVKVPQIWDMNYPASPALVIEYREVRTVSGVFNLPHAIVDQAGPGLTRWEAWLGGQWVECFWRYHKTIFGKRFSAYSGLRPDYAVGFLADWTIRPDTGAWFPDISASFVREN
jgi:hypothetical protein